MSMEKTDKGFDLCAVAGTIRLISGKYKAVILYRLLKGTLRYSEIHRYVPYATDKMLAQHLRELEKDGLIERKVYPVVPPRTEYSLTEFGMTLEPVLTAMSDWGTEYFLGQQQCKQ